MPTRKPPDRAGTSAPTWPSTKGDHLKSAAAAKAAHATKPISPTDGYVTVAEAAELLRVCTKTVRNRIGGGELEAYRHGRRILIPLTAIERLIRRGRM
jgi:excisionase family DNA binding protein